MSSIREKLYSDSDTVLDTIGEMTAKLNCLGTHCLVFNQEKIKRSDVINILYQRCQEGSLTLTSNVLVEKLHLLRQEGILLFQRACCICQLFWRIIRCLIRIFTGQPKNEEAQLDFIESTILPSQEDFPATIEVLPSIQAEAVSETAHEEISEASQKAFDDLRKALVAYKEDPTFATYICSCISSYKTKAISPFVDASPRMAAPSGEPRLKAIVKMVRAAFDKKPPPPKKQKTEPMNTQAIAEGTREGKPISQKEILALLEEPEIDLTKWKFPCQIRSRNASIQLTRAEFITHLVSRQKHRQNKTIILPVTTRRERRLLNQEMQAIIHSCHRSPVITMPYDVVCAEMPLLDQFTPEVFALISDHCMNTERKKDLLFAKNFAHITDPLVFENLKHLLTRKNEIRVAHVTIAKYAEHLVDSSGTLLPAAKEIINILQREEGDYRLTLCMLLLEAHKLNVFLAVLRFIAFEEDEEPYFNLKLVQSVLEHAMISKKNYPDFIHKVLSYVMISDKQDLIWADSFFALDTPDSFHAFVCYWRDRAGESSTQQFQHLLILLDQPGLTVSRIRQALNQFRITAKDLLGKLSYTSDVRHKNIAQKIKTCACLILPLPTPSAQADAIRKLFASDSESIVAYARHIALLCDEDQVIPLFRYLSYMNFSIEASGNMIDPVLADQFRSALPGFFTALFTVRYAPAITALLARRKVELIFEQMREMFIAEEFGGYQESLTKRVCISQLTTDENLLTMLFLSLLNSTNVEKCIFQVIKLDKSCNEQAMNIGNYFLQILVKHPLKMALFPLSIMNEFSDFRDVAFKEQFLKMILFLIRKTIDHSLQIGNLVHAETVVTKRKVDDNEPYAVIYAYQHGTPPDLTLTEMVKIDSYLPKTKEAITRMSLERVENTIRRLQDH